ncbi:MAG: fumarylacetoacetate hydrolase family protein [Candidatus Margulisiibacteriota bacterium]|jgi:2-keto-4-pentenoate hydratase/2-oxohepta-3-ene-1,7-dioic acid hydratase in catechol pathway
MAEYVRYRKHNEIRYGALREGNILEIRGDIFGRFEVSSVEHSRESLELLPPVEPTKIIAVGLNYLDHAQEMSMEIPTEPLLFLKPPSAVIGHDETIILPRSSERVDFEAELAIVISKKAYKISANQAEHYILGYTCANDVTARDFQKQDGQWARAKSFNTFCPLGPAIVTDVDTRGLDIKCLLNGEVVQSSNTRKMIFKAEELVSYISQVMTLFPGDVIITGTPPGVNQIKDGDTVEIQIDQLGTLRNYVKLED